MVLDNSTTQALDFYADQTFTSPTTLVSGVNTSIAIASADVKDGSEFGSNIYFVSVITGSGTSEYRVTASGVATQFHTGTVGSGVVDDNNLYFIDLSSSTTATFYQEPLGGGTPSAIYSGAYSTGASGYQLIGSNNTLLIFQYYTSGGASNSVMTVPVGTTSTSPNTIGGP
jgi:hypothetical protein